MSEQPPAELQPPVQQSPYGYPPPGHGSYPQPGFPQQGYGPPPVPKHPQAQTAMALGIIALAGGFSCVLPIFASPFAWYFGAKAKREIAAEPGRWSGQSDAQAGFIMGIIGTILIAGGIVVLVIAALFIALAISSDSSGY